MHGIFDSGVGGLSVWKEIKNRFPESGLLYFADQAHVPYGDLPLEESFSYVQEAIQELIQRGATSISLGCQTVSTTLSHRLREYFSIPIYDIASHSLESLKGYKKIALIGTTNTINSHYFQNRLGPRLHSATACPKFAPMVESGTIDKQIISSSLPLALSGATCLLLACTHFSFIAQEISEALGGIKVIDPAPFYAKKLPLLNKGGKDQFFTTGDPNQFHLTSQMLLQTKLSSPFFIKPLHSCEKT